MTLTTLDECSVEQLLEQFPAFMAHYAQTEKAQTAISWKQLEQAMRKLRNVPYQQLNPRQLEAEQIRAKHLQAVAQQAIALAIGQRFPVVDPALLKLERWLIIEWQESERNAPKIIDESRTPPVNIPVNGTQVGRAKQLKECLQIPLVLSHFQTTHRRWSKSVHHPRERQSRWGGNFTLSCQFPGQFDPALKKVAEEAFAIFYDHLAWLYRQGYGHVAEAIRLNVPLVNALWIPRLEDFGWNESRPSVTDDPALVIKFNEQLFLVGTWQVKQEVPDIHALVQEFSSL